MTRVLSLLSLLALNCAGYCGQTCPDNLLQTSVRVSSYVFGGDSESILSVTAARDEKNIKVSAYVSSPGGASSGADTQFLGTFGVADLAAGAAMETAARFKISEPGIFLLSVTATADGAPNRRCTAYGTAYFHILAADEIRLIPSLGGDIMSECSDCVLSGKEDFSAGKGPVNGLAACLSCPGENSPFEPINARAELINVSTGTLTVPLRGFGDFGFYAEIMSGGVPLRINIKPETGGVVRIAPGGKISFPLKASLSDAAGTKFVKDKLDRPLPLRLVYYSYPLDFFSDKIWHGYLMDSGSCAVTFSVP
ncbi:MAG: hypothetical protein WCS77_09260 [Elusimicrobiaceae bacterium]